MAKKCENFADWCRKNNRTELLQEWHKEKNDKTDTIPYNSPKNVYWKCDKGHEWIESVIARTLFNRKCPTCNPEMTILPVGTKYGCLTIIENKITDNKIQKTNTYSDWTDIYNQWLENTKTRRYYKCQCKCGMTKIISEYQFLKKRHKYCTDTRDSNECGLKRKQREKLLASYERIFCENYEKDYTHTFHESLEVLECIDKHYEKLTSYHDMRKKGGGTYTVYKLYRCRCYLCGKEQTVNSTQFNISPPTEYGIHAYHGYYSEAYCDCHKISSFQWIVNKILKENNIPYRVEVQFPDLHGWNTQALLRYDFAILNPDGTIKCLLECQGEQHYKPIEEFGGKKQFENQQKNDELKRKYASKHKMTLLEISYKEKKYEKIKEFLQKNAII